MILFKGVPQEVLSHVVAVDLQFRINPHHIADEIKIPERNPRLKGVYGDAAVSTQHVVHVQLVYPLLALLLEGLRRGGEVRVLVSEQLIGNLSCHQYPHIGLFMNRFAAEVHADARPYGGDVPGAEHTDDLLQ